MKVLGVVLAVIAADVVIDLILIKSGAYNKLLNRVASTNTYDDSDFDDYSEDDFD